MIYADTNFFTNTLVDMSHRSEAEGLLAECPERLPVTWLHRLEVVNALQQCVFLTRQGMQQMRVTPELAAVVEAHFFEDVELGIRYHHSAILPESVEAMFQTLSHRHTAKEGFRTYDLLHVSSALVLGCDTFWSFDAKAKKLAALEGLWVN
jgi:predicted nucleic acid-binding protein